MKRILLITFMLVSALISDSWAQTRSVTGKVTSAEDGSALPGVNVILKGTTSGTVTDIDGNYRVNVPEEGGTLVFSFIGLTTQEVAIGARSVVDVKMQSDVKQLNEVVVTAVGIEREERALGYGVETVEGDQIQQVAEPDPLRALQGKIAGVNISGSSGAPGSATRITIRGNSSLLGNNQPLFVVDGIPYSNATNNTFSGLTGGAAYGSRISDLDPNNIESMTVLKGGAAAALYGTRAANGVILITTKTGSTQASKKGLEIAYGVSYGLEKIANLPEYQNSYGTGTNFEYSAANGSWGAPFIGARPYANLDSITHWYSGRPGMEEYNGVMIPYRAYPDNVEKLFRTGSLFENTITISGGNATSNLAVTLTRSVNEGYVPNTEFNRTNISVGGRTELKMGLNVGANLAYTKTDQKAVQSGVGALGGNNPSAFARALYLGRNWDIHGNPYQNPVDFGSEFMVARGQADNPLWSYENAGFRADVDRIVAAVDFGYDITDWLNVSYKIGINTYTQRNTDFLRPGSTGPEENPGVGQITDDDYAFEEIESNFLISFNKDLSESFNLRATVGHNLNQRTTDNQAFQGLNYVTFDIDDIDNTNSVVPFGGDYERRRILGVFGDISLGYNNWAFLGLTGRNDWSSTLPKENRSFFYPAVTGSVIVSDALELQSNILSFLKVRGGWSQVGSDTDPYQLNPVYLINSPSTTNTSSNLPFNGIPGATLSDTERDPNLKPERTTEVEVGTDIKLFNNRIGIEATYYKRNTTDQIAPVSLAAASGFGELFTNFGEVQNEGVELGLDLTPVSLANGFNWNIYGTFTHNKNTIVELREDIEEVTFGYYFSGSVRPVHRAGEEYGLLVGTVAERDDEGNFLIDPANGQLLTSLETSVIGNPNPDFIVGITNTFSFKGLSLRAVFDWRQGGDLWSNTVLSMLGRGVTKDTEDREVNVIIPGVYGDPVTLEPYRNENGEKIPNKTMIEVNSLYFGNTFAINGIDEFAVWDATTFRLREVTLGYDLPESLLNNTPIGSLNISFTGRNLWFKAPNFPEYTNFDPEINQFANSNQQGIEYSATPSTKRYAVNLRVTF